MTRIHAASRPRDSVKEHGLSVCAAGFTLLELAMVVTILAIIVGASLPAFNRFQKRARLSAEASRIVQTLRYAQQRSVLERKRIPVVFDLENKAYWIPRVEEDVRRQEGRGRVRKSRRSDVFQNFRQKISEDYVIDLFYYPTIDQEVTKDEAVVNFYPDGTADGLYLTLLKEEESAEESRRIFIKVSAITGLVKVHEGVYEYEGWDFYDGAYDDDDELS